MSKLANKIVQWFTPGEGLADSSNVRAIAFDELTGDIYVNFMNGSKYRYYGPAVWSAERDFEDFKIAESTGKFLHSRIRPFYSYERIE